MMAVPWALDHTTWINQVNSFLRPPEVPLNGRIARVKGRITLRRRLRRKMLDQAHTIQKKTKAVRLRIQQFLELKTKQGHTLANLERKEEQRIVAQFEIIMKMENRQMMLRKMLYKSTLQDLEHTCNYSTHH